MEPTIWDFIEMNKSGKYTHLKITPGTEEDRMLNFVALHLPSKSKTLAARLLIKAGFKVFLNSMENQEKSK